MSLDNLLGKSLERIEPDSQAIGKLIAAAARSIEDSKVEAVSNESRFDSAYKALATGKRGTSAKWIQNSNK